MNEVEFVAQWKKRGYKFSQYAGYASTRYELKKLNDKREYMFIYEKFSFFQQLTILPEDDFDDLGEENLFFFISYIKNQHLPFFIGFSGGSQIQKEKIKNILFNNGFLFFDSQKELIKRIEKYRRNCHIEGGMIESSEALKFETQFPDLETFDSMIRKIESEEMLFYVERKEEKQREFYFNGTCGKIKLVQKGKKKELVLIHDSNKKEEIYEWSNLEKMEQHLSLFLAAIQKRNVLKNLFQPTTYFFDHWSECIKNDETKKTIYESFKEIMTTTEIEEFCAYFCKKFDKGYEVDNDWFVYRYQNNVVVVAPLDEQVWLMNQTETWKEDVINKIIEFKKEKMKQNLTCIPHEGKKVHHG